MLPCSLAFEQGVFQGQLLFLNGIPYEKLYFIDLERLGYVILCRYHHHHGVGGAGLDFFQQTDAVKTGHIDIRNNQIKLLFSK